MLKTWLIRIIYLGAALGLATPLFIDNGFFFPFISTKVFFFRAVVEAMLLAYLFLNFVSEEYRLKVNWLVILTVFFIVIASISSALGGNFYQSFWGDVERGEGIILWLHLLALLVILTSVVRSERAWAGLLDTSLGVGILMGLFGFGQAFGLKGLLATSGSRVDATLGNAAFFGTYLLFQIMFALYLFKYRGARGLKIYYLALAAAFAVLIPMTQTRGALIGLVAGIFLAAPLLYWLNRDKKSVRYGSIAGVLAILIAVGFLYFSRERPFVQENSVLRRMTSISTQEKTAQTRLLTWKAAWNGWREKFLLGGGVDNFDVVFNKNFPAVFYEDPGSVVWYDRAHNVVLDRGATTGILGLLVFLALFIYPAYYFWKMALRDRERSFYGVLFLSFLAAYLIQDLFIFESIATYIILFFTLAFWGALFLPAFERVNVMASRKAWVSLFVIYLLAFGPILYKVNFYPAKINRAAAEAAHSNPQEEDFFLIVDRFKASIEPKNYGQGEYRLQFIDFVGQQVANVGEVIPKARAVVIYTDQQLDELLKSDPDDAKNFLLAMRHYNYTYAMDSSSKIARLEKALSFFPKLVELSPTRPHAYQEAGYSHAYLYREYKKDNDKENMERSLARAEEMFQKTIELSPRVIDSYANLVDLYLTTGKDAELEGILAEMAKLQVSIRSEPFLTRFIDKTQNSGQAKWRDYFLNELTQLRLEQRNVDGLINIAVYYATIGNRTRAIEIGELIKSFGGDYVRQAELFIENVNKGAYEAPTK
ncbi:MAG: O-antigen ligase family protein [Candidatus Doudnabacteria bacterium]|nr:O-antigen ligase family protein [bacterium]MDZ4243813.1 O-antigen ligase family protein [Candidatus Doudnabacteria bacterium]